MSQVTWSPDAEKRTMGSYTSYDFVTASSIEFITSFGWLGLAGALIYFIMRGGRENDRSQE